MTGVILIVLFAVLGVTIVQIGQLIWLHLFLGLLLLGPVLLKLASTGYRFLRYYTHDAIYRAKGPPMPALRADGASGRALDLGRVRHRRLATGRRPAAAARRRCSCTR